MLIALTAVAVIACRVPPLRQVTTATALARRRNASLVCVVSWSLEGRAGDMRDLPFAFPVRAALVLLDAVPYCTLQRTVRYSKMLVGCNGKIRRFVGNAAS